MTSHTQWILSVCCLVLLETSAAAVVHGGTPGGSENRSSVLEAPCDSDLRRVVREQQGLLLTLQSAMVELQNTVLEQQNTVLELQNTVLGLQSLVLGQHDPVTSTAAPVRTSGSGGATYIRWGRTSCPDDVELVYEGYAGGSWWDSKGAAVDYLCLPKDPQYANYTGAKGTYVNLVYGAEYETMNRLPNFHNANQDVPCAVCRIPTRSTVLMIPAKTSCYAGYHREYFGYLMSGSYEDDAASQFVCVDHRPENVPGGHYNQNGKIFYFVEGRCGSLPCPPYVQGRELTCVVCSK